MSDLAIYGMPQSNFVWAARVAAAEKGIPHALVDAAPGSPEIAAVHPFGRMPVMRHGAVALAETRAIVRYIDRAFDGPPLEDDALIPGARDEMWASLAITAIDAVLIRAHVFAYLFPGTADGTPDLAAVEACWPRVELAVAAIDRGIADGEILGDRFRLPDLWLVPILYWQRPLPGWSRMTALAPRLSDALDRALERPAVAATLPPPLPQREAAA
jgi:glutathione S-transferase